MGGRVKDPVTYYPAWRAKNLEKVREQAKRWASKSYAADPTKHKAAVSRYRARNKAMTLAKARAWKAANADSVRRSQNVWYIKRRQEDPTFRLLCNMRSRLSGLLAGKVKAASTLGLAGCTIEELKAHLEARFQPGMTWDNYGAWHVDHIKPCVSFDLAYPEQQRACFHFTNLQPLWAADNMRKGTSL